MKNQFHFKPNEDGQSFVELALILPILFIFIAGVLDLGRLFLSYMELRDAAQEGANYASIRANDHLQTEAKFTSEVSDRVKSSVRFPLQLNDVAVVVSPATGLTTGNDVTVTVKYDFPVTAPFIGIFFNGQTIKMEVKMTNVVLSPVMPTPTPVPYP